MRRFALAATLASVACAPPSDYTPQIVVQPGAAARSMWIRSHARAAGAPAPVSPAARVHVMAKGEELGGPNAVGRPGDLLLENDAVAFVVSQVSESAGFAESGGNLVDAADARDRKDELGQVFTYFGTFPRQGVYEALTSGAAQDGSAWIEATGHELYEPKVRVVTRYTLRPGERALLLETKLTNAGDRAAEHLSLGDAIQWGGAEKFAPGKSVGFRGLSSGAFIGGVGRVASYAIASTDGPIDAVSGGSWTDTTQPPAGSATPPAQDGGATAPPSPHLTLAPSESVAYARVFVVGERADTASLTTELMRLAGENVGAIEIALVDEAGRAVPAPSDAKVILSSPSGAPLMSIKERLAGGAFGGEVPPGHYQVAYASGGGRTGRGAKGIVDVAVDRVSRVTIGVTRAGSMRLQCGESVADTDARVYLRPLPCKVTIEGIAPTTSPDFGPLHVAGPARNQITTADGAVDVLVSPGTYKVTLSRGPEYALTSLVVDVPAGGEAAPCIAFQCAIARVVDTKGYVATDFHQHTMLSADAPVATRDRVIANAAEGVEIAVASEHNVVADLEPIVNELSLSRWLVALPGNELTSDASKKPWGHANVYPLARDPNAPRGGASDVRDKTPRELFAELRKIRAPHVLQINHPRTGITGYFEQMHFDAAAGVGKDPDYDPDFDALEVWNGRNVDAREAVLADFLALVRTKHPVTPTADTDTHGIVGQEAGYPRTYVKVTDDANLEAWDAARSADLVKGVRELRDVVLTNGPFLRVRTNGAPIGGIAKASGRSVEVAVHVECAPWTRVERLEIRRASGGVGVSAPVVLKAIAGGAEAAEVTLHLTVDADDAIVVIASGGTPMAPVLSGDAKEITPYAMTGAIWIDADGDGKSLGR